MLESVAGKWKIRNDTCSASYAFERVHRFSVEAAMRLMLLLQCFYYYADQGHLQLTLIMSLGTSLTLTARGGTIPDVVMMAAHPGLQYTLRLGEASLRREKVANVFERHIRATTLTSVGLCQSPCSR